MRVVLQHMVAAGYVPDWRTAGYLRDAAGMAKQSGRDVHTAIHNALRELEARRRGDHDEDGVRRQRQHQRA